MSESGMRGNVLKILKPLDGVAVENPTMPGTPDINYVDGFIELKWLRSWPKDPEAVVRIEHYSPQQRLWIRRRHLAGGKVWLLLQCKREWLLFCHPKTMEVGKLTRQQLYAAAHARWEKGLDKKEFLEVINTYPLQNGHGWAL